MTEQTTTKEKVLSVGKIRRVKSSYGGYAFNLEIQTPKFKTNKTIFGFTLKKINLLKESYLKELKGGIRF